MSVVEVGSDSSTAGYQRWTKLTFLHWRVAPEILQPRIPQGLTIQTFDGSAWLGLVPFSMERVRPWWSPPVPGVSWFLETNIRTYVVDAHGNAGVWFFSLDANSRLAVTIARTFWHLPYFHAAMKLRVDANEHSSTLQRFQYTGARTMAPAADYELTVDLPNVRPQPAQPESLEHFLIERYLLFATDKQHRLRAGRVHHAPYRIMTPISVAGTQSLTAPVGCHGLDVSKADHVAFSPGVDVRISPLRFVC